MTTKQVKEMLDSVGIPNAYYEFTEETAQPCPFICFYYPNNDDMLADNTNYIPVRELIVELYTDNKDFSLEHQLEAVFRAHGLTFSRAETYLKSEHMYMEAYTMEVLING